MDFEIVKKEEVNVCGISIKLTNSQKENYHIITRHWRRFNKELSTYPREKNGNWEKFALTIKKSDDYFYMPAVPLTSNNTRFETATIHKGNYAKFVHHGDMRLLKTTVFTIYKQIIPNSKLHVDPKRTVLHYEHYDYRFNWNRNNSIIDIYIPLE